MARRSTIVAVVIAAAVALAAGVYFGAGRQAADARASAATLLALSLPDLAGKEVPLAQWKGKLLVVNFWATWCVPCREEMPEFVRAQKEFGDKGLQFVGIAIDEADKIRQFADSIGLNYPALIGGYGGMELSRTLGNRLMALPFTVIVDREGTIVHTQLGPLKPDQLRRIIDKFI
jgi:thiol-disulfide isomerase/thioredoxin